MHSAIKVLPLVTCALILAACDGPLIFMAGGKLSGDVAEPPTTWQLNETSGVAQLETRPADPYSINLAYVQLNSHLYVYAGSTRTTWVEHIELNPQVRIRVAETIYPMQAVRVTNVEELTEFAAQWASRSMFQRDPMQFDEVWLYRLEGR